MHVGLLDLATSLLLHRVHFLLLFLGQFERLLFALADCLQNLTLVVVLKQIAEIVLFVKHRLNVSFEHAARIKELDQVLLMRKELLKCENFDLLKSSQTFLPYLVEEPLRLGDCLKEIIHELFIIGCQPACCLNLANNVLVSEQLVKPVISALLVHLDQPDKFEVRVNPDPQDRIRI